jgi:hypothetical protein
MWLARATKRTQGACKVTGGKAWLAQQDGLTISVAWRKKLLAPDRTLAYVSLVMVRSNMKKLDSHYKRNRRIERLVVVALAALAILLILATILLAISEPMLLKSAKSLSQARSTQVAI